MLVIAAVRPASAAFGLSAAVSSIAWSSASTTRVSYAARIGFLEVARSREVMVERAFADAQAAAEAIDAEAAGPFVSNGCQAGLDPIGPAGHVVTVPYGMVWRHERGDRDWRWAWWARGGHHGRRGRGVGHAA